MTNRKMLRLGLLFTITMLMLVPSASADITGDTLQGCMFNHFVGCSSGAGSTSNNWFVTFGPGTTATVGSGVEFYQAFGSTVGNTIDFTGTGVTINYTSCCGFSPYEFFFTNTNGARTFTSFYLASISGLNLEAYSFTGSGLYMRFSGQSGAGTATFGFTSVSSEAPVPEPGTLILLGTGLLGAGGTIRRRFIS